MQFARVQIAGVWYRISEGRKWWVKFSYKRVNGKWTDNGSAYGLTLPTW